MMNYRIKRGDTLSGLAEKFHTSLGALEKANKQIKDPNLIYAGANLKVPGAKDSFHPAQAKGGPGGSGGSGPSANGGTRAPAAGGASSTAPAGGPKAAGNGSAAYNEAKSVLGTNIDTLKYNGSALSKYLDKSVNNHVCCANFVSACLEKAGEISPGMHDNTVKGLASELGNSSKWSSTSLANAKPGDVVCFNVPGEGPMSHVEMFAGWKNGQPQFIGSNNVNADGSQRISEGHAGYPIGAIYHYNG